MLSKYQNKILIVNGFNSTNGGGLRIFGGFVRYLTANINWVRNKKTIIIFSANHSESLVNLARNNGLRVVVFRVTGLRLVDNFILYYIYFPFLYIKNGESAFLINFGDIIVPFVRRQLYYFDWLYAVVKAPEIWAEMKLTVRISRLLKCAQIKIFIDTPKIVTVQSRFVADQMSRILGRKSLHIIPCPIDKPSRDVSVRLQDSCRCLPETPKLLCLSSFATHKNVRILADVAERLLSRNINVKILLTLDNQDKEVKSFLKRIQESELNSILINIGVLTPSEVESWINECDALLLPTKLETFGLPFMEGLSRGKPILTSDLAFAREVCQTGTIFFNPDNPDDITEKINQFLVQGGVLINHEIVESIMEECRPEKVYARILGL